MKFKTCDKVCVTAFKMKKVIPLVIAILAVIVECDDAKGNTESSSESSSIVTEGPSLSMESTIYPILYPTNSSDDHIQFLDDSDTFSMRWNEDFQNCGATNLNDECGKSEFINYRINHLNCRCDDKCLKYGDCCVSVLQSIKKIPHDSYFFSCEKLLNTQEAVRMITKCPLDYPDNLNKEFCEEASEAEPLASLEVPVVNTKTRDIYRNIYCARCHSVPGKDTYLNFDINCTFNNTDMDEFKKNAIYVRGQYYWQDPENETRYCNLILHEFHPDRITSLVPDVRFCSTFPSEKCPLDLNSEENLVNYHLCSSYTQIVKYFAPTTDGRSTLELYKNPHCALCVHPDIDIIANLTCERSSGRAPMFPPTRLFPQADKGSVGINILFDFSFNKAGPVGYFSKCEEADILDFIRNTCVPRICPNGYELVDGKCKKIQDEIIGDEDNFNQTSLLTLSGGNETIPGNSSESEPCLLIILHPGDYYKLENGSIAVNKSGNSGVVMFTPEEYNRYNESSMAVCAKNVDKTFSGFAPALSYISNILLAISVLCSFAHVVLYIVLPKMRNLPGNNLLSLTSSLLISQFIFLTLIRASNKSVCVAASIIMHYLFLAAFCWMNIMSFDIWRTFSSEFLIRRYSGDSRKTFLKYSLFAWFTPMVIVLLAVMTDFWLPESLFSDPDAGPLLKKLRPLYGQNNLCWISQRLSLFVFFAFPVALIILCNCILFTLTASTIWWQNREGKKLMNGSGNVSPVYAESQDKIKRKVPLHGCNSGSTKRSDTVRFKLYAKLALIMGLTWILGFLSGFTQWEWCWYPFVIFNGLQGTFIFLAFDFKPKVWNMVKDRCGLKRMSSGKGTDDYSKRSGLNTLSTTLRSTSSRSSTASTGTSNALIIHEREVKKVTRENQIL